MAIMPLALLGGAGGGLASARRAARASSRSSRSACCSSQATRKRWTISQAKTSPRARNPTISATSMSPSIVGSSGPRGPWCSDRHHSTERLTMITLGTSSRPEDGGPGRAGVGVEVEPPQRQVADEQQAVSTAVEVRRASQVQ